MTEQNFDLATSPTKAGHYSLPQLRDLLNVALSHGQITAGDENAIHALEIDYQNQTLRLKAEKESIFDTLPALRAVTAADYRSSAERQDTALFLAAAKNPQRAKKITSFCTKIGDFCAALHHKNRLSMFHGFRERDGADYLILGVFTALVAGGGYIVGMIAGLALAPVLFAALDLAPIIGAALFAATTTFIPALGLLAESGLTKIGQLITGQNQRKLDALANNPALTAHAEELKIGLDQLHDVETQLAELEENHTRRQAQLQQANQDNATATSQNAEKLIALKTGLDVFLDNNLDSTSTIRLSSQPLLAQAEQLSDDFSTIRQAAIKEKLERQRQAARASADEVIGQDPSAAPAAISTGAAMAERGQNPKRHLGL